MPTGSVSVIIQVVSFKTTGKRVFLMAPILHRVDAVAAALRTMVGGEKVASTARAASWKCRCCWSGAASW